MRELFEYLLIVICIILSCIITWTKNAIKALMYFTLLIISVGLIGIINNKQILSSLVMICYLTINALLFCLVYYLKK